jgi:hypothetical protein
MEDILNHQSKWEVKGLNSRWQKIEYELIIVLNSIKGYFNGSDVEINCFMLQERVRQNQNLEMHIAMKATAMTENDRVSGY